MFARWHLCCITIVIITRYYYFWIQCSTWIMFAKLLYLMLVSFHYNSLITVNDTEIFVCINDIPLLNVTFLYVSKYTDENIFSRELSSSGTKVPGNESSTLWNYFHPWGRKFLGTKVPAFVALAASGDPGQTKQNVKITFINCDFLKKSTNANTNMRQTSTKVHSHPSYRTRAVLSQGRRIPSVQSACPIEVRSCHRVVNGFKLSRLSHVLGIPRSSRFLTYDAPTDRVDILYPCPGFNEY